MYFTLPQKYFWHFLISIFAIVIGVLLYVDLKTPHFLFIIKDGMMNNSALMDSIGGEEGWRLQHFDDEYDDKIKRFEVEISGGCDSAHVQINGTYTEKGYSITDTILVKCK